MPPKTQNTDPTNLARQVDVELTVELCRTRMPIQTLLNWSEGSLIELDRVSGEAVEVCIDNRPFALGEVVTIGERFGVRLVEMVD